MKSLLGVVPGLPASEAVMLGAAASWGAGSALVGEVAEAAGTCASDASLGVGTVLGCGLPASAAVFPESGSPHADPLHGVPSRATELCMHSVHTHPTGRVRGVRDAITIPIPIRAAQRIGVRNTQWRFFGARRRTTIAVGCIAVIAAFIANDQTIAARPNEPIADNKTKAGQAQNQRIEFKILQ